MAFHSDLDVAVKQDVMELDKIPVSSSLPIEMADRNLILLMLC